MLPRHAAACEQLSPPARAHLAQSFALEQTENPSGVFGWLQPVSHAAACVALLRAGYRADAETLLGRPITHLRPQPAAPLLVTGTAALLARLAARLPPEAGPKLACGNTRLYDSLRVRSVGPEARRIGPRARGGATLQPGVTVGQLLRRGMSRRRLSEAVRLGWITLAEPTA